jgi:hypothetical protein
MAEIIGMERRPASQPAHWNWRLWLRWVADNAAGEAFGLGLAGALGAGLVLWIEARMGASATLAAAAIMIMAGTIEGIIVGVAQWLVLRRPFPRLRWQAWLLASAVGACVAWALGMIPSTLISLTADSAAASPPDVSDALMYSLAAAMGAVLGPILGVPQWLALRQHAQRAIWWVPANAAAWALGMPVVFIGAGSAPPGGLFGLVVTALLTAMVAGGVVGAIHGLALIWLIRPLDRSSK